MTKNINISIFIVFLFALLVNKIFWFLPFVLIIPVIATMVLPSPLIYLGVLSVLLEFFSTSVPGIMTAAILLPWLIVNIVRRFYKEVKIDFLISFYLLVGLIIFSQIVLLSLSQIIDPWLRPAESQMQLWQVMLVMPWLKVGLMVIASTVVTTTISIFIRFNTSWQ